MLRKVRSFLCSSVALVLTSSAAHLDATRLPVDSDFRELADRITELLDFKDPSFEVSTETLISVQSDLRLALQRKVTQLRYSLQQAEVLHKSLHDVGDRLAEALDELAIDEPEGSVDGGSGTEPEEGEA